MKILLAGAGAIGQWLGARLLTGGHDVTLLVRPRHSRALAAGIAIRGHTTFLGPIPAVTTASEAGSDYDAVIITGKAHQTATLGHDVTPTLSNSGFMISLQNGFGNHQKLQRFLPANRIVVALTSHGVTLERPGQLFHAGTGPTLVGPAAPGNEAASRVAHQLFTDAKLDPEFHADMRPMIWRKALANAGINPVGALKGITNGTIAETPEHLALAQGLLQEGIALAAKAQVDLPPGDLAAAMQDTLRRTKANKCSMLQDVEAERITEIEQITGRLVRLGKRLDVAMPLNESAYARIKSLEASYVGRSVAEQGAKQEMEWEQEPF